MTPRAASHGFGLREWARATEAEGVEERRAVERERSCSATQQRGHGWSMGLYRSGGDLRCINWYAIGMHAVVRVCWRLGGRCRGQDGLVRLEVSRGLGDVGA